MQHSSISLCWKLTGRACHFFDLNKDIVEVLIGEIMFNHFGEEYHNNDEDFIEGDKDECRFILDNRRDASVTSKKHTMSVFKL